MKLFKRMSGWMLGAAVAGAFAMPALADEKADLYPLTKCPVSGKELGANAVVKEYDGREVRFCCDGCPAGFEKDAKASLAKLDEEIIKAQEYALDTCLNSGEALGEKPVTFVLGNRVVKTCCANCQAKLEGDEAAALEKHTAAVVEKLGKDYPSEKCPVSGEELGSMGEPVNVMVGNQLVKLCCAGCNKAVVKEPAKYAALVWSGEKEDKKAE